VAATAAGGVLVWSGLKGASVSVTLKSLISGRAPSGVNVAPIGAPAASGSAISADAMKYDGVFPYVWGGAPASGGGDCSSFVNKVVGWDLGMAIPGFAAGTYKGLTHGPSTVSWLAWSGCTTVSHDGNNAQPGDLCIWQTHMGIVIGRNQMISAQDPALGTGTASINGSIPGELLFIRRLKGALDVGAGQLGA
jgi:cell wall-associated NlpC family hydrolase